MLNRAHLYFEYLWNPLFLLLNLRTLWCKILLSWVCLAHAFAFSCPYSSINLSCSSLFIYLSFPAISIYSPLLFYHSLGHPFILFLNMLRALFSSSHLSKWPNHLRYHPFIISLAAFTCRPSLNISFLLQSLLVFHSTFLRNCISVLLILHLWFFVVVLDLHQWANYLSEYFQLDYIYYFPFLQNWYFYVVLNSFPSTAVVVALSLISSSSFHSYFITTAK